MIRAKEIISRMEAMQDERQRKVLMRFFKTGKGEYGEGDMFLGIKVPQTRAVVKTAVGISLDEVPQLLECKWHEVRLCGFLILVAKFEALDKKRLVDDKEAIAGRDKILGIYLKYAECANNWDLVDLSAPKILGRWLLLPSAITQSKLDILDSLAYSNNLWKKRISIVCTWATSHQGDPSYCLRYAEIHLHHPHDLMHKAVGWMLREMGKHAGIDILRDFLKQHASDMPRTTLRYAIEKMTPQERQFWMHP